MDRQVPIGDVEVTHSSCQVEKISHRAAIFFAALPSLCQGQGSSPRKSTMKNLPHTSKRNKPQEPEVGGEGGEVELQQPALRLPGLPHHRQQPRTLGAGWEEQGGGGSCLFLKCRQKRGGAKVTSKRLETARAKQEHHRPSLSIWFMVTLPKVYCCEIPNLFQKMFS